MISGELVRDLRPVLSAQRDILSRLGVAVDRASIDLSDSQKQADDIKRLKEDCADVTNAADDLPADALDDFDPIAIPKLYERSQQSVQEELHRIGFTDWPAFVRDCAVHCVKRDLDPFQPYEVFLEPADVEQLRQESYRVQYRWDAWDWTAVGASAVLAALTDCLLVRIPRTIVFEGKYPQTGSPLTRWVKRYDTSPNADRVSDDWFAKWARELADWVKVPYDDQTLAGMGSRTHRIQSLGHDPILGFVFGVADILRGTVTGFSYDRLLGNHRWECAEVSGASPVGLIEAFLRQIGHLVSDVATPMGLPAPLMPLAQALNVGNFGRKERTVAELARFMYANGYDLRHFLVAGLVPGLIEALLRGFVLTRHYRDHGEVKIAIGNHPKYRLMLLTAHTMAAAANAGKVALYHGNPLAINQAQWLAFGRYLLPTLRYWLFDRERLKLEHIERINEAGWAELETTSAGLIEGVMRESPSIDLGDPVPAAL